jgi:hypothetical protein
VQPGEAKCTWCGQDLQPRRGGSPQRFCSAEHRSLFWSALRRWGERAVAGGILTIADIAAACTLPQCSKPQSPLPDIGGGDTPRPDEPMRFVVEVERETVAWLVRLRFISPDQGNDLGAIIAASKRLGLAICISRNS